MMITRQKHAKTGMMACVGLLALLLLSPRSLSAQVLDATSHPKFKLPLPRPAKIDAVDDSKFKMVMKETVQWLGLEDVSGNHLMTTVWGYGKQDKKGTVVTYPGGGTGIPGRDRTGAVPVPVAPDPAGTGPVAYLRFAMIPTVPWISWFHWWNRISR